VADLIGLAFKQIPPHYALSFSPGNHKVVVNRIANFCCAKDWRTLLGLHSNEKLGLAARVLVFFVFPPCAKQAWVFQIRRIATHALHVWRTLWGCIPTKSSVSLCEPWSFLFSPLALSKLGFFKFEGLPPMRCMCGGPCGVAFIQIPSMLCMAGLFCFDSSLKQAWLESKQKIPISCLIGI